MKGFGILVWTALCFYGWIKLHNGCEKMWTKILATLLVLILWAQLGSSMGLGYDEEDENSEYIESHRP